MLLVLAIFCLLVFVCAIIESKKGNSFKSTKLLYPLGIFVWGDGLVFAPFWALALIFYWIKNDISGLGLFICIFWAIRSLGEIIYWINEQFATRTRNDPKKMIGYSIVKNESVYFLYQIFWQCILTVSILIALSLL